MTPYLARLVASTRGQASAIRPRHRIRAYAPAQNIADEAVAAPVTTMRSDLLVRRIALENGTPPPLADVAASESAVAPSGPQKPLTGVAPSDELPDTFAPAPAYVPAVPPASRYSQSLDEIVERIVAGPVPTRASPSQWADGGAADADPRAISRAAPASLPGARQAIERARDAAVTSGPVTNIHIGRVEVVAVPPPRRLPAAPAKQPMSLDEYLRRRDGKGR